LNPTIEQLIGLQNDIDSLLRDSCIIAGGAVRDIIHNKSLKDIDVWVDHESYKSSYLGERLWRKLMRMSSDTDSWRIIGAGFNPIFKCKLFSYGVTNGVQAVYESDLQWNGYPIQIIAHSNACEPQKLLDTFDLDICKIALYQGRIVSTPEYHRDVFNKTITQRPSPMNQRLNDDHLQRVAAKFPGWRLQKRKSLYVKSRQTVRSKT
jgi:hypothetical protein